MPVFAGGVMTACDALGRHSPLCSAARSRPGVAFTFGVAFRFGGVFMFGGAFTFRGVFMLGGVDLWRGCHGIRNSAPSNPHTMHLLPLSSVLHIVYR
ncbi:hypothetical protein JOE64_002708 [Microbacterium dextranolyticum]|nr:hypothetical protein [Microbacterium dextranolyticum]